jgi:hypothetical protein
LVPKSYRRQQKGEELLQKRPWWVARMVVIQRACNPFAHARVFVQRSHNALIVFTSHEGRTVPAGGGPTPVDGILTTSGLETRDPIRHSALIIGGRISGKLVHDPIIIDGEHIAEFIDRWTDRMAKAAAPPSAT